MKEKIKKSRDTASLTVLYIIDMHTILYIEMLLLRIIAYTIYPDMIALWYVITYLLQAEADSILY